MASSSSYPGSSSRSYRYDVFLSFRGEDTRLGFVDHLYKALADKSINTFKDNINLLQGEYIGPSLFTAIEESQIALVVFSENYANSSWCLEELTYIMKCKEDIELIVMPIFYGVEPTDVRKQKRKYGEAFARYENENTTKVALWKKSLIDSSKISGFDSKNRPESEFIKEIVDKILDRLPSLNSYVDEEFVGMKTRLQDMISRLEIGSDGVCMIGIWGVGGGGKTTLATSVYMEISHDFEGNCIVENIREKSSKDDGLKKLQEKILSAVSKTIVKVSSVVEGKRMIRNMLCRRKVLVVLDDVDKREQLEALAGSRNWFGSGSRIIITTRDEHVLRAHKVDKVCLLRLLSAKEAMELFNRHAYNEEEPIEDYEGLSSRVVTYAAGLPLALKVLGSFLCDKNEKEWLSALARLEKNPNMEIVEKLKISYDGLAREEKELFLEIACCFRGHYNFKKDNYTYYNAREILKTCFHLEIGIKVLRQKSLITIDAYGMFEMHDLVQEMAHYIVRGEYPNNVECHSRIWNWEEVENMCLWDAREKNDKIEAIGYGSVYCDHKLSSFNKNVSNMKKLRWVDVATCTGDGGPTFLSNELRYIRWIGYPEISFPDSFQPTKLVVLKLSSDRLKVLWNSKKDLPCLKVLQLLHMKKLVSTPDFDRLPSLEKLTLTDCDELEEIHPSLGNHTSLEYVSVSKCKLRKFPTIVQMGKLHTLEIEYCLDFIEFPEIQANMESLVNLSLKSVGIKVLASSIGERCTNLTSLCLIRCNNLKSIEFNMDALSCLKSFQCNLSYYNPPKLSEIMRFHQFPHSLQKLRLHTCGLEDGKLLSGIVKLSSLEELDLSWKNKFTRLDSGLSQLTQLKILNLEGCSSLVGLPKLPLSIAILKAPWCESLTDSLTNCKCLCYISLEMKDGNRVVESILQGKAIENGTLMILHIHGRFEIPKGLKLGLRDGSRRILELPENWRNKFSGFLIFAVGNRDFDGYSIDVTVEQVITGSMDCQDEEKDWKESDDDKMTWVGYISFLRLRDANTRWWDDQTYNGQLSFCIDGFNKSPCSGFGVRLVAKTSESGSANGPSAFSQFSNYTSRLEIQHVSPYGLKITFE